MNAGASRRRTLAGVAFILGGATIIQWSAAIVQPVFSLVGPSAASGWRFVAGAVALVLVSRPRFWRFSAVQWRGALALGVSVAFMNLCFYQSIARIPLGAAVAIEYLGPFLVAAFSRRSLRHLALVALAGIGVLFLARPGGGITLLGALFALGSGVGWVSYAFTSHHVGALSEGFDGLAVAMSVAAVLTLPFALGRVPTLVEHPLDAARLALVGVMAIAVGFAFEMQALRRIRPGIASVILALDPAVAFLSGWVFLAQPITPFDLVGLACVVGAGVGVTLDVTGEERVPLQ